MALDESRLRRWLRSLPIVLSALASFLYSLSYLLSSLESLAPGAPSSPNKQIKEQTKTASVKANGAETALIPYRDDNP